MPLQIDQRVLDLGVRAVAFSVDALDNRNYSAALQQRLSDLPAALTSLQHLTAQRDTVLAGFLRLRERSGRSWKRFPPSSQTLLDMYNRRGSLPAVAPAVDCYNLLSLASGLSLGAHDLAALSGPARLTLSTGGELFRPMGSDKEQQLPAGEYLYRDDLRVLCRMDCRQAAHSALQPQTRRALFIVQGHDALPRDYLDDVAATLRDWLSNLCAASVAP